MGLHDSQIIAPLSWTDLPRETHSEVAIYDNGRQGSFMVAGDGLEWWRTAMADPQHQSMATSVALLAGTSTDADNLSKWMTAQGYERAVQTSTGLVVPWIEGDEVAE